MERYKIQYILMQENMPLFMPSRIHYSFEEACKSAKAFTRMNDDCLCYKIVRIPDGS